MSEVSTNAAFASEIGADINQVHIYKIVLTINHGMSTVESVEHAVLKTEGWTIQDVKFVDDCDLILAMSTKCERW